MWLSIFSTERLREREGRYEGERQREKARRSFTRFSAWTTLAFTLKDIAFFQRRALSAPTSSFRMFIALCYRATAKTIVRCCERWDKLQRSKWRPNMNPVGNWDAEVLHQYPFYTVRGLKVLQITDAVSTPRRGQYSLAQLSRLCRSRSKNRSGVNEQTERSRQMKLILLPINTEFEIIQCIPFVHSRTVWLRL